MGRSNEFIGQRKRAGYDSEFKADSPETKIDDVWSMQFWTPEFEKYCDQAAQAHEFLRELAEEQYILYGWNLLCDIGAAQTWLHQFCRDAATTPPSTCKAWKVRTIGNQIRATLQLGSTAGKNRSVMFVDLQPVGKAMGLGHLSKAGKYVGVPKLPDPSKCESLAKEGKCPNRHFPCANDETRWHCPYYAINDSEITFKFGEMLRRKYRIDPAISGTGGQVADHYFALPKRLEYDRKSKVLKIPKAEYQIAIASFAGRAEMFMNGYVPETWLNDVTSLYPFCVLQSKALRVLGVEKCDEDDLDFTDKIGSDGWGWVCGRFTVPNTPATHRWGLPLNYEDRNYYVYGSNLGGIPYNTLDLVASHAELADVGYCLRPVFDQGTSDLEEKYRDIYLKRLSGELPSEESGLYKLALNATPGRLGQVKPKLSRHTNFPAYSGMLACSHLVMRQLMDRFVDSGGVLHAMDTDSLIGSKRFEVNETVNGLPLLMGPTTAWSESLEKDVEVVGEGHFFRPKRYLICTAQKEFKFAAMGWRYTMESFQNTWEMPETLDTTKEVRRTLKTREKAALVFRLGGWSNPKIKLEGEDLRRLLSADHKRRRPSYDSLQLCEEKRSCGSVAMDWSSASGLTTDNLLTEEVYVDYELLKTAKSKMWYIRLPKDV